MTVYLGNCLRDGVQYAVNFIIRAPFTAVMTSQEPEIAPQQVDSHREGGDDDARVRVYVSGLMRDGAKANVQPTRATTSTPTPSHQTVQRWHDV